MPFPESQREVYERNPLKEVICQLRFPTILQVTSESPAQFQNSVRKQYPIYVEEIPSAGLPKEVSDILAGLPVPKGVLQPIHKFLTENGTRFISLSQQFLAVSETDYKWWDHFRKEIEHTESAFRDIYEPAFYSRIGLRYKNVIDRDILELGNHPWDALLNKSLIGVLGAPELAQEIEDIRTLSLLRLSEVPNGFVQIRHGLDRTENGKKPVYVIDADFFTKERSEPDDAFRILDAFNKLGGRLFRWAITPTLRDALRPKSV